MLVNGDQDFDDPNEDLGRDIFLAAYLPDGTLPWGKRLGGLVTPTVINSGNETAFSFTFTLTLLSSVSRIPQAIST